MIRWIHAMVCFIFPELKEVAPFLCKPSLGGCTTPPANRGRQSGSVPRTRLWFMTNKYKVLQTSYSMIKLLTGSDNIKAEIYTIYTGAQRATSLPLFSESGIKTISYSPNDTLKSITPLEDATDVTFLLKKPLTNPFSTYDTQTHYSFCRFYLHRFFL